MGSNGVTGDTQLKLFDDHSECFSHAPSLSERIDVFAELRYKTLPYTKRNWGHSLHSLCSYQGKLKPAIAHFLVSTMTSTDDRVLDPFSGAGTIPLEACLLGRVGDGVDINPLAYANTLAKVALPSRDQVSSFRQQLAEYLAEGLVSQHEIDRIRLDTINGRLQDYFHHRTFAEVVTARKFFSGLHEHTPASALVLSCLLHILHGNRPYALSRRSHGLTPFAPTGPFEYKPLLSHLDAKIDRTLTPKLPPTYVRGSAHLSSVFDFKVREPYDAIITSPPFLKSTRFYIANWIRLWFCGWEDCDFKSSARGDYLEQMQAKSMAVYQHVFSQFAALLKTGGVCVLHLGVVGGRDMGTELIPHAKKAGFRLLRLLYEDVSSCEKHGVRAQGSTLKHQFLFLAAPSPAKPTPSTPLPT